MTLVKSLSLPLVAFLCAAPAWAAMPADTASLPASPPGTQERMWRYASCFHRFADEVYANPSAQLHRYNFSLSSASLSGEYSKESEPLFYENGDGYDAFSFEADTYIRRHNFVLWGDAAYSNSRLRNVRWNETSDHLLLYPYLTADSIGGDFDKESYSFAGGYAGHAGRIAWGTQLSYVATIAYRGVDPRPKNVTSRLSLRLGLTYLWDRYGAGIFGEGEKYKQTSDIDFYSEMGSSKVYHLTGMAMHYVRFAGNNYDSYYNGYRWRAGIELHPLNRSGWHAWGEINRFAFEKILSSLNELPLASVTEYQGSAGVGYKMRVDTTASWGVVVDGRYVDRRGTENIFGDAAGNIYPQIASMQPYRNRVASVSISGYYEGGAFARLSYAIEPRVSSSMLSTTYAYPARSMAVNHLEAAADFYLSYVAGRSLWRFEAGSGYRMAYDGNLDITTVEGGDNVLLPVLQHTYRTLAAADWHLTASLCYAVGLKNDYTMAFRLAWQHHRYDIGIVTHYAAASLSLVF